MGIGQNQTTWGPQVWSLFAFTRVSVWVPIFDPHPVVDGEALASWPLRKLHCVVLVAFCWGGEGGGYFVASLCQVLMQPPLHRAQGLSCWEGRGVGGEIAVAAP